MPFSFDEGDLDEGYFGQRLTPKEAISSEVKPVTRCKNCDLRECRGCRGKTLVLKDLKSIVKGELIENAFSPLSPLTPEEQRFFDLTGHVPGDAWEGEMPDEITADVETFEGVQLCRSLTWPEVMEGAEQERQWGRKTTLALMYPCHEGQFEWYEHPTTKRWHSYAAFRS